MLRKLNWFRSKAQTFPPSITVRIICCTRESRSAKSVPARARGGPRLGPRSGIKTSQITAPLDEIDSSEIGLTKIGF